MNEGTERERIARLACAAFDVALGEHGLRAGWLAVADAVIAEQQRRVAAVEKEIDRGRYTVTVPAPDTAENRGWWWKTPMPSHRWEDPPPVDGVFPEPPAPVAAWEIE
jgi:hypothetical protein